MIKKLRKKFIIAAMCAILIVLESMILAVNIVNYRHLVSRADTLTEWIASEGGSFGDLSGNSKDPGNGGQPPERQDSSDTDPSATQNTDDSGNDVDDKTPPAKPEGETDEQSGTSDQTGDSSAPKNHPGTEHRLRVRTAWDFPRKHLLKQGILR